LEFRHHRLASLREVVAADIRRYLTKSPHDLARGESFKTRMSACLTPEVFPVVVHRMAHYLYATRRPRLAVCLARLNQVLNKVNITPQSCIGPGLRLPHPAGVTFHGRAGRGLTLYSMACCCPLPHKWDGPVEAGPSLGANVTLAGHAVVQGSAAIGDGTTVGYGIELDHDAPAGVLVSSQRMRVSIRQRARVTNN
jgi:serine acetyltransferase